MPTDRTVPVLTAYFPYRGKDGLSLSLEDGLTGSPTQAGKDLSVYKLSEAVVATVRYGPDTILSQGYLVSINCQ